MTLCHPPKLLLRRANTSGRGGGPWDNEDYHVFDGDKSVGRIYQLSGKKRCGREPTREAAMAALKAEYVASKAERGSRAILAPGDTME
jgi:hypothetical protein